MKPIKPLSIITVLSLALIYCSKSNTAREGKCFKCESLSAADTSVCGYQDKYEAQRAVKHNTSAGLVAYDCTEM